MGVRICGLCLGVAGLLAISGCTGSSSPDASGTWQTISPSTTASPSTTTTSSAVPTVAPPGTVPVSVSLQVQNLAAQLRVLRELPTSAEGVKSVASALASGRASIKRLRATAYGTGKSCTSAAGYLSATRDAAAQAGRAASSVDSVNATRRTQIAKVNSAIAAVGAEVSRQKLTMAKLPTIASALKDAQDSVASAVKQASDTGAAAASGRATAAGLASTASDIYSKGC